MLAHRHQVGKHLAGMAEIGQTVDDRNGTEFCEVLDLLLRECADHDAVEIARKYARRILHRFAAADLEIVG